MNQSELQELLAPIGSADEYGHYEYNNNNLTNWSDILVPSNRSPDYWPIGGGGGGPGLEPNPHLDTFQKVIDWMDLYFLPSLILVGLVGNSLSVCVFILSHLRRLSSSVYLAALAVADAGFLLCALAEWCSHLGYKFSYNNGWCQILNYLRYVWSFLSVWYVVSFTIERYIAVCLPFQRQKFCTTKRAKAVVLALALTAAVLYNWTGWTMASMSLGRGRLCMVQPRFYNLNTRLEIVDTVLTLIIPSILITVLNIRIIYAVFKIHRDRRHMGSVNNGEANGVRQAKTDNTPSTPSNRYTHIGVISTSSSHSNPLNTRRRHHNSQVKVTKMLVLVSSIFLVLNLPNHALRLYNFANSLIAKQMVFPSTQYILIQRLFQYLNYTNFAINFFLYNTCGRNFRHALRHLGRKIRYNIRHKCVGKKYREDDIAIVVPVKRKPPVVEEDIHPISGQHNMSMHRCQSLSHSGSRSQKGSKNSKGVVEMRSTAVQLRSHHSHNSCHSYHSREISHHSREFSHHSRAGAEFSHHGRSDFSHHSRYASPSCSDVSTSSCSHRSLHRCKPL